MTGLAAIISAYWWLFVIALAVVIILIVGVSWAASWYFWKFVIEIEREAPTMPRIAYGDSTHLAHGYWDAVARKEAKERAR